MESLQDKLAELDYPGLDQEITMLTSGGHDIKAILFDLDGVLVDGNDWHREALMMALHDAGWDVSDEELVKYDGMTAADKLVELRKAGRAPSAGHDNIVAAKRAYMLQIIEKKCKPIPRIQSAVSYADLLMKCAVVTNCSRDAAELMLKKSNLSQFISVLISSDDVGRKHVKPSAYPYVKAAAELGVFAKDCLVFDDTQRGITSALEAGCKFRRVNCFDDLSTKYIFNTLSVLRIRI
jgi:beta-phosphoglucomutase-like phosphatase (HAD superfamily)